MFGLLAVFLGGLLFAIGLGISGMTDANKVIGFLNVAGDWDPSLMFVMVGGIGVHLALFRLILKRQSPLFDDVFHVPNRQDITSPLVIGSGLFGIGWGLGGFCPGPGLVSLTGLDESALVFVGAMVGGMLIHKGIHRETGGHLARAVDATEVTP